MVIGAVFAGGSGSRMGSTDTPKQYLMLGSKPIIVHTVEKLYLHPGLDHIVVLCPENWIRQTLDMLAKSLPADGRIDVIAGGASRNDTLANAIAYVENKFGLGPDTVLLTHDAVRPFVTHRIISENIEAALKYGACDTVVAASDTIVESADNCFISTIPERRMMYQGQTPQTFLAQKLKTVFESLTPAEKSTLTDACKIFSIKGEPVRLVEGEVFNIKITYPFDLKVAAALLEGAAAND